MEQIEKRTLCSDLQMAASRDQPTNLRQFRVHSENLQILRADPPRCSSRVNAIHARGNSVALTENAMGDFIEVGCYLLSMMKRNLLQAVVIGDTAENNLAAI